MSELPDTLELDRLGLERLKMPPDVKAWLRNLIYKLEQIYQLQRDSEKTQGFAAINWRFIEDDDGNMKAQVKIGETWTDQKFKLKKS